MTATAISGRFRQVMVGAAFGAYGGAIALIPQPTGKIALCASLAIVPISLWLLSDAVRWVSLFFVAAWLLPPFPVNIGNSGPHVAVLVAASGLLVGLLGLRRWRFFPDFLATAILAVLATLSLSLGFALAYSGLAIAFASTARLALFGISVYTFFYLRDGPGEIPSAQIPGFVRILFVTATVSAFLACFDFYFQLPAPAGYGPQFIWLAAGVFRRAQGVFYEASTLGNLCAFFLVMAVVALVTPASARPVSRRALMLGALPLSFALLLSYSRASAVNLCVALAVLIFLRRKKIPWARAGWTVLATGCTAGLILKLVFPTFFSAYFLRATASAQYFVEAPNAVLSGRLQTWNQLIEYLLANPQHLFFGIGYKTLPYSTFTGSTLIADNTYLSTLAEAGVVGLAALLLLNLAILSWSYRTSKSGNAIKSFLGTWLLCSWSGQVVQMLSADLLTYWRILPAYFAIIAIAARRESPDAS